MQGGISLGMLPIHKACAVGNLDEVKSLVINEQCDVNVRDDKNHTKDKPQSRKRKRASRPKKEQSGDITDKEALESEKRSRIEPQQ